MKVNLNLKDELDQTKISSINNNNENNDKVYTDNIDADKKHLNIDIKNLREDMIDSANKYTDRDTNRHLKDLKAEEIANKKIALIKSDERFFKNVKEIENVINEIVSDDHLQKVYKKWIEEIKLQD